MPPAFALSQDQTLRFIQASPQSPKRPHSNTQTNFQRLITLTKQISANPKQPSTKPQNPEQISPKRTPAQAPTAHPTPPLIATRQNTQQKPSTQPSKDSQALSTSKKTRCNCQTTKKEPATERLTASHIAGPLNHTDHRQGEQTSQTKPASQALITNNLSVSGLLYTTTQLVKRPPTPETNPQSAARLPQSAFSARSHRASG